MDKDLKSKTISELERFVAELGQQRYVAGYIFSFIQSRGVTDIAEITPLSKSFRDRLIEDGYFISSLKIFETLKDPDETVKYVFKTTDGNRIESVLLFSPAKSKRFPGPGPGNSEGISQGDNRRTLCVSTQAGCAMNCVFCATGRLGLKRNLTTAEIIDQANLVMCDESCVERADNAIRNTRDARRITNIVFMGMGEPLANYDAVIKAVRILNHPAGLGIGIRHLTISTCGLTEGIERLANENIKPRLAISLNAPTDAIRQKLMPVAKKYTIGRLLQAVKGYQHKTRNRVTFEYCLIKGVNDSVLHAGLLVKQLKGVMCNVNLIEYNRHAGCSMKPSGKVEIERFANVLKKSGIETTIRPKMGQTINAACGQLGAKDL